MNETLTEFLHNLTRVATLASVPAVLVILFRWRKLSRAQRWFGVVVLLIFLNEMMANGLMYILRQVNMPLYHVYLLIELPGILLLYRMRFRETKYGKIAPWAAGVFAAATLINAIFFHNWYNVPSVPRTIEALMLSVLALFYFRTVFQERKIKRLDHSFWFWISAGLFLYFSANLMLFMFTNSLTHREDDLFLGVWSIHAVLNFLLYAFYSIAFLCQDRESSSSFW